MVPPRVVIPMLSKLFVLILDVCKVPVLLIREKFDTVPIKVILPDTLFELIERLVLADPLVFVINPAPGDQPGFEEDQSYGRVILLKELLLKLLFEPLKAPQLVIPKNCPGYIR